MAGQDLRRKSSPAPDGAAGTGRLPHPRFFLFLLVFGIATAAAAFFLPFEQALVLGFDLGALAFLGAALPLWLEDHPNAMRQRALRDDGGRALLLLVSLVALLAVFGAMFTIVSRKSDVTGRDLLTVIATLVLAWLFVNTLYAHHYGHLYYRPSGLPEDEADSAGLNFPGTSDPIFADFCYFSFVIGMTSQVSDVTIQSRRMRRTATLHGLLAFSFNLGVMAMTINVMASALG